MQLLEMFFRLGCAIGLACLVGHLDTRTSTLIRTLIGGLASLALLSALLIVRPYEHGHFVDSGVFATISVIALLVLIAAFRETQTGSSRNQFWRQVLPLGILAALIAAVIFGYAVLGYLKL